MCPGTEPGQVQEGSPDGEALVPRDDDHHKALTTVYSTLQTTPSGYHWPREAVSVASKSYNFHSNARKFRYIQSELTIHTYVQADASGGKASPGTISSISSSIHYYYDLLPLQLLLLLLALYCHYPRDCPCRVGRVNLSPSWNTYGSPQDRTHPWYDTEYSSTMPPCDALHVVRILLHKTKSHLPSEAQSIRGTCSSRTWR